MKRTCQTRLSKVKVKNDEFRFGGQLIDLEKETKRDKKEK